MSDQVPIDPLELPSTLRCGGIRKGAKAKCFLEIEYAQGGARIGLEPQAAIDLGRALIKLGRETMTGLTVVGDPGDES